MHATHSDQSFQREMSLFPDLFPVRSNCLVLKFTPFFLSLSGECPPDCYIWLQHWFIQHEVTILVLILATLNSVHHPSPRGDQSAPWPGVDSWCTPSHAWQGRCSSPRKRSCPVFQVLVSSVALGLAEKSCVLVHEFAKFHSVSCPMYYSDRKQVWKIFTTSPSIHRRTKSPFYIEKFGKNRKTRSYYLQMTAHHPDQTMVRV